MSGGDEVRCGVPQGSVLGPLFFNLFIDFVFRLELNSAVSAYADDLTLTCASEDLASLRTKLQCDIDLLASKLNNMGLNISSKSKFMLYNNPSVKDSFELFVSGTKNPSWRLERVSEQKYLGIIVDQALNWKAHIGKLRKSLISICRYFYTLRSLCPLNTLLLVYSGLVNGLLSYCVCAWGSASKCLVDSVIVLQKRILRVIHFKNKWCPTRPIFVNCNILNCRQIFIFRCLKVLLRKVFLPGELDGHKYLRIPLHRTERRRKTFRIISRIIFNNLPIALRASVSISKWRNWVVDLIDCEFVLKSKYAV